MCRARGGYIRISVKRRIRLVTAYLAKDTDTYVYKYTLTHREEKEERLRVRVREGEIAY